VLAPGLFTTVQDICGRGRLARFGVPAAGALDPIAAAVANALVANPPDAAVLEITLAGPTLRFTAPTVFGLAGADLSAELDGRPVAPGWSRLARAGSALTFGERRSGARAYLAVGGGLAVPAVLGSRSADVRAGFGGLAGRPLRTGDHLPIQPVEDVITRAGRYLPGVCDANELRQPVHVVPGPHVDHFRSDQLERFCSNAWQIGDQADRMGYRLVGPRLEHAAHAGVASIGLPLGAVQVPGDGRPIVLLADHQPTGGYTVLVCVSRADLHLLAQRAPGEEVRFTLTTVAEAHAALRARYAVLRSLDEPDAATWASVRWAS
jgi:antagonist of KipI